MRRSRWTLRVLFPVFFLGVLSLTVVMPFIFWLSPKASKKVPFVLPPSRPIQLIGVDKSPARSLSSSQLPPVQLSTAVRRPTCSNHNCLDTYKCGRGGLDTISIYIYPIERILVDGVLFQSQLSREWYEVLETVRTSRYYTANPAEACIFMPSFDILNLDNVKSVELLFQVLTTLPFWGNTGQNHLLLTLFGNTADFFRLETEAMIAASKLIVSPMGFHVPMPLLNPLLRNHALRTSPPAHSMKKKVVAVWAGGELPSGAAVDDDILMMDWCSHDPFNYSVRCQGSSVYLYPEILTKGEFCIIYDNLGGLALWDVMSVGCIPVILSDTYRLPFDEIIDWKRNAILMYQSELQELSTVLRAVSKQRRDSLRSQVRFTFQRYFSSISQITTTLLQVLQDRVFPHSARSISQWNEQINTTGQSPMFNTGVAFKAPGFTAVILAYERLESLFQVIDRVARVPSLAKVLIIWNNPNKTPPPLDEWPRINKPLKVIRTTANRMSNRFFPYGEIETEAVLSLDDDIIMLTVDEIQFAYETWCEFPDRIVGFPSRTHVWDNSTERWKYESEWTNDISMVLTGAAFYHKYWHHAYTFEMHGEIREWVDSRMNCEDIAMNFLVAYRTGKAPMKVTPRKKFKCPSCTHTETLSADSSHMRERTECINRFARQINTTMPLHAVQFRADPVLFAADSIPGKLKRFRDIGSL